MKVTLVEDREIPALQETLEQIDWTGEPEEIVTRLPEDLSVGQLTRTVLHSPLNFDLSSQPREEWSVPTNLMARLKPPAERNKLWRWWNGWDLVKTYDPIMASVLWYECHVPHSGSAYTVTQQTKALKGSIGIKLFGSGFETGRELTLTIEDSSAPQKKCSFYYYDYVVRPRLYRRGTEESWGAEFVRAAGDRPESVTKCKYCSVHPVDVDLELYDLVKDFDLRRFEVDQQRNVTVDWKRGTSLSLSVPIPHAPAVSLPITASASSDDAWKIHYSLPRGWFHQGYRPKGAGAMAHRWAYGRTVVQVGR